MDAFEKLAKLAGASVESVGEGLPRTRAEAKARGVARYFTGAPCKHEHVAARLASTRSCCECNLQYMRRIASTPEGKDRLRQHQHTRRLGATPERKECERRRQASPEHKERQRQYALSKCGDEILFAIRQAEGAARIGRFTADIVPQCPEPQRSQLQALVDRIKADPQAGKAVVGLLQTMRELRKAELAELRSEP